MTFLNPNQLFPTRDPYTVPWNGNIVLLTNRNSPTKDIYFTCRYPESHLREVFPDESPTIMEKWVNEGDFIVIVRTLPRAFLKALKAVSHRVAGVAWFIDDDIPAAWVDKHLPNGYGRRLTWSYLKSRRLLSSLCDRIWVSSQWLADKYGLPKEHVISPGFTSVNVPEKRLRYFYHGSKAHIREMQFLRPIVEEIQRRYEFTRFEIFGDHDVYKLFRDVPGTRILHPMKWEKFRQYTAIASLDIGFAPVLDSAFNKARSHNKMLDISRCGAVGIYSYLHAHSDQIQRENAGLVIDNEPGLWVDAFDKILNSCRSTMLGNARKLLTDLDVQTDLHHLISASDSP